MTPSPCDTCRFLKRLPSRCYCGNGDAPTYLYDVGGTSLVPSLANERDRRRDLQITSCAHREEVPK